jgi:hypothetical protein
VEAGLQQQKQMHVTVAVVTVTLLLHATFSCKKTAMLSNFERQVLQQGQGLRQARRARAEQALLMVLMIYNKKTLPNMQHKSNLTLKKLLLRLARLVVFQARSRSSSHLPRTRCLALPGGGGGGGGGRRR